MKRLFLLLIVLIALLGCEKERCYECIAKYKGFGITTTSKTVICGTMSKKEAEDMSMVITSDGYSMSIVCTEQ